jgi:hypothetical protein
VCISPLDIPQLVLEESDVLLSSIPFLRLAACLREYNKDLATIPEGQEDYGRHVIGVINLQEKIQMPEKLAEFGDYSLSVRFFDNKEKDWEFMLIPSRGDIKHRLKIEELPPVDKGLYENLCRKGTLDGLVPYTAYLTKPDIPHATVEPKEYKFPVETPYVNPYAGKGLFSSLLPPDLLLPAFMHS